MDKYFIHSNLFPVTNMNSKCKRYHTLWIGDLFISVFLLLSWSPRRIERVFAPTCSPSLKRQWAAVTTQVLPIYKSWKQRSLDLKAHQSGAALGVDLILPLVLVFDQSCYPGVGILLETIDVSPWTSPFFSQRDLCLIAPHNPSTSHIARPPTCAASVAVDRRERERRDDQVGRVLREETMVVLLPGHQGPVKPFHYGGLLWSTWW